MPRVANMQNIYGAPIDDEQNPIDATAFSKQQFPQFEDQFVSFRCQAESPRLPFQCVDPRHQL
jgi:hypothetical protein